MGTGLRGRPQVTQPGFEAVARDLGSGGSVPVDLRAGVSEKCIIPSARGKGYASEALRGLLLFARSRGVTCVKGDADHDNIASQHVMMPVGMRPAGQDERVRYFEITWTHTTANTDPRS